MRHIQTPKGQKNVYMHYQHDTRIDEEGAVRLLGEPVAVVKLLSDQLLVILENHKNFDEHGPNQVATTLLQEPIYGPCLICDPEEFPYAGRLLRFDRKRNEDRRDQRQEKEAWTYSPRW